MPIFYFTAQQEWIEAAECTRNRLL